MDIRRIPGPRRRYQAYQDGQPVGAPIGRREYDRLYGRLAKAGVSSNEALAKRNAAEDRAAQLRRPAPGRIVKPSQAAKTARALPGKMGRYLAIPFDVAISESAEENIIQALPYQKQYEAVKAGIAANNAAGWTMLMVEATDGERYPIKIGERATNRNEITSLPDFIPFVEQVTLKALDASQSPPVGKHLDKIIFYIHMKKEYFKPKPGGKKEFKLAKKSAKKKSRSKARNRRR